MPRAIMKTTAMKEATTTTTADDEHDNEHDDGENNLILIFDFEARFGNARRRQTNCAKFYIFRNTLGNVNCTLRNTPGNAQEPERQTNSTFTYVGAARHKNFKLPDSKG